MMTIVTGEALDSMSEYFDGRNVCKTLTPKMTSCRTPLMPEPSQGNHYMEAHSLEKGLHHAGGD